MEEISAVGFSWWQRWRRDEQANDNSIKSLSQSYSTFISTSPAFLEIINPEIKLQLLNKKIQLKIWSMRMLGLVVENRLRKKRFQMISSSSNFLLNFNYIIMNSFLFNYQNPLKIWLKIKWTNEILLSVDSYFFILLNSQL